MSFVETRYEHIVLDESGVPVIAGTRMRVEQLVLDKEAYGWSPEEMCYQHPQLALGQVYSALAYYADHSEEIHREIEEGLEFADRLRREQGPSPLRERLKAKGLI